MAQPPKKATPKKPRASKSRKPTAKAVKKIDTLPPKKPSRRGTPKGKGVVAGRNGGRIGNPKFKPTDEQRKIVETHAACGTPHWLIALELKITLPTLQKYFRYELDTGLLRVNARIGSLVAKQALTGDRPSQSLWLKSRGGWNDKLLLTTPAGQPIELAAVPRNPDLKRLSIEELQDYRRIQAKLEGVSEDDRQL